MATQERSKLLIDVVERERDKRCAAIVGQARSEAHRMLKQAWSRARARLHLEVLAAREQFRRQLLVAQASQATRQRQAQQGADRLLLDEAWQLLHASLIRRWQQPEARQAWVEALIGQALAQLVNGPWTIECPADWPEAERHALATQVRQALAHTPVFVVEPTLEAGIRVRAGNSVVDGSCAGLLHDRAGIEGRLLAAIRKSAHA